MRVFHFMRYKWWFLVSLTAVTVFAFVFVFVVGFDLGIDFQGGVRMEVTVVEPATVDDVRQVVTDTGVKEPVVQSVSGAGGGDSFLITAKDMSQDQVDQIIADLNATYGVEEGSVGVETVGGSFGQETTNRTFIAIAIAVIVIVGYLTLRFEFKFAIPAIVALIHDVGLTLGIYAASNRLVTAATVAAILTILGYSVHDTIVLFDRMRENTHFMKKETYGDMIDLSIRQTMVRSINTTVALLLPLVAILIFGGPTLKDFAMALTIGVVAGTYSSFFVAAPLVCIWKEREPRYRKRLAAATAGGGPVIEVDAAVADTGGPSTLETTDSSGSSAATGSGSSGAKKPTQAKVSQKSKKGKTSKRPPGKNPRRKSR